MMKSMLFGLLIRGKLVTCQYFCLRSKRPPVVVPSAFSKLSLTCKAFSRFPRIPHPSSSKSIEGMTRWHDTRLHLRHAVVAAVRKPVTDRSIDPVATHSHLRLTHLGTLAQPCTSHIRSAAVFLFPIPSNKFLWWNAYHIRSFHSSPNLEPKPWTNEGLFFLGCLLKLHHYVTFILLKVYLLTCCVLE